MIDVSVEITTYNRKEVLRSVLDHLVRQTYPADRFEVVISDDGSSDGLLEMVDALGPRMPYTLRVLRSTQRGPGYAHNCGIRACQADLVIMLAADILPVPALVEEHVRTHRQHPPPNVVVAGKLIQSEDLPDTLIQRGMNRLVEEIFADRSSRVQHGGFLVSNLSFKKRFMLEKGMFREWPPASGEDLELGSRLRNAKMQLVHNPLALGRHYHEETLESISRRAYMMGYHSHYFVDEMTEDWVKRRFGRLRLADGPGLYLISGLPRALLRPVLASKPVTSLLLRPLIRAAERGRFFEASAPLLCKRVLASYFNRGVRDFRHGRPFDLSRADV